MVTRRSYKRHVQATDRDKGLMAYLGEHGCASSQQIALMFWEGRKLRTCTDRLELLVKAGFLHEAVMHSRGVEEKVYWIQRKASLLFDQRQRQGFSTGKPSQAEVAHICCASWK